MTTPLSRTTAKRRRATQIAVGAALGACSIAGAAAATECGDLAGRTYGNASISSATNVAPPSSLMGLDPPAPVAIEARFCRVEGIAKSSERSSFRFEVWLPEKSAWNGKYQGVGNGGFAGSLILAPMNWALLAGYAVSATDTGHSGGTLDASWAKGEPEKIVDFGWRAVHGTAEAAKAIIADYYQKAPAHSYFSGCSDGGREALMEAERFPTDYDGIVAGAPANNWSRLLSNAVGTVQALNQPGGWIPPEKLAVISKAVHAQCPAESGYVEDPSQCRFDPSNLVCKAGEADNCLTEAQISALKKIYSGAADSNGKPIYPGYPPGGESGPTAWELWISGKEPARTAGGLMNGFSTGFFGNFVFDKPGWGAEGVDVNKALASAQQATGEALDSSNPDLSAFRAAGGKLIQYHGWNDSGISATGSILWYDEVAGKLGGMDRMNDFYRLFMAPGMDHCGGGPGPSAVGGVFGPPPVSRDRGHDIVAALAHWVEDGVAPDHIIATRYRDNDPAKGIEAQRPWCAYPASARYSGQGKRSVAANYVCATPVK